MLSLACLGQIAGWISSHHNHPSSRVGFISFRSRPPPSSSTNPRRWSPLTDVVVLAFIALILTLGTIEAVYRNEP